jgi:hypothetical protein
MESCNCSDRPARDAISAAESNDLIFSSNKPSKNGGGSLKNGSTCQRPKAMGRLEHIDLEERTNNARGKIFHVRTFSQLIENDGAAGRN